MGWNDPILKVVGLGLALGLAYSLILIFYGVRHRIRKVREKLILGTGSGLLGAFAGAFVTVTYLGSSRYYIGAAVGALLALIALTVILSERPYE